MEKLGAIPEEGTKINEDMKYDKCPRCGAPYYQINDNSGRISGFCECMKIKDEELEKGS